MVKTKHVLLSLLIAAVVAGWHLLGRLAKPAEDWVRMVPGSGSATGSLMPPISRFDSIRTENGSEARRPGYTSFLVLETTSSRPWRKSARATCRITRLGHPKCVSRGSVSRLSRSDIALHRMKGFDHGPKTGIRYLGARESL